MSIKDKSANDTARFLLLGFAFLTMIPFGSNRPFFWAFWALAIALLAMFFIQKQYVGKLALGKKTLLLKLAAAIFAAYALHLTFQLLPIETQFMSGLDAPTPINLVSQTLSIAPGETWFALLRWATYGVLFILVFQLSARSRSSGMLLFGLSIIVGLQALYALAALLQLGDTILFFEKSSYFGVTTGTFINRNSLATLLSFGAIVSATILTTNDVSEERFGMNKGQRFFTAIALAFIIAALFATNSRMGLFAGAVGVLTAVFLRMQSIKHVAAVLFLAVIAGTFALYFYGFGLVDRAIRVEGAFDARLELYQNTWEMIMARPFSGYGGGTFAQAYQLFHERSAQSASTWDLAHSTYLAFWAASGFVFGSLPIIMLLCLTVASICRSNSRKGFTLETAVAVGASVTAMLHSLLDFSLEIQAVAVFYVIILAIGCSRAYQAANDTKSS